MAVSITCPPAAQMHLRTVLLTYPPHGLSALVSAFLHAEKLTERKIREVAAFRGVTLTMVVRALMVKRYPELKPLWPAPKHTSAQIDGISVCWTIRTMAGPSAEHGTTSTNIWSNT
jgi:hypothetical protein